MKTLIKKNIVQPTCQNHMPQTHELRKLGQKIFVRIYAAMEWIIGGGSHIRPGITPQKIASLMKRSQIPM